MAWILGVSLLLLGTSNAAQLYRNQCNFSGSSMDCSRKRLSYIPESPKKKTIVLILDLSYNEIEEFHKEDLAEFGAVTSLDLSYNLLVDMKSESLTPLKDLLVINLSHNQIIYLQVDVFSNNSLLEEVHLNDNNLQQVPDLPPTTRILNLRSNKIFQIQNLNLPLLKHIDLSHNRLKEIPTAFRIFLLNVPSVKLNSNPWKCTSHEFQEYICPIYRKSGEMICSSASGRKRMYNPVKLQQICDNSTETSKSVRNLYDTEHDYAETVAVAAATATTTKTTTTTTAKTINGMQYFEPGHQQDDKKIPKFTDFIKENSDNTRTPRPPLSINTVDTRDQREEDKGQKIKHDIKINDIHSYYEVILIYISVTAAFVTFLIIIIIFVFGFIMKSSIDNAVQKDYEKVKEGDMQ